MSHNSLHQNTFIKCMNGALDWFIILNILVISVLICTQVALRYVFRMPLMGIEELCYFPTAWLYLGAAIKASAEKGQLVARVLEIFVHTQKNTYLLRMFAAVLSCAILCWLTYWGYDLLKYSLRVEKLTDSLFIRWLYIEGAVFISFALMLFYTVVEFIDYYNEYRTTDSKMPKLSNEEI